MKLIITTLFSIVIFTNSILTAQSCYGLQYSIDIISAKNSNSKSPPSFYLPPQFVLEGENEENSKNGMEILNSGVNGLVICSPQKTGIISTQAGSYSAYFSNKESSSNAAVQIAHGDDEKMDLQLEGVGRTAGQDGYIVNIDSDEDGDESFLITGGGGTNLFRVRESDGTFTKDLGVQGKVKINEYLSINANQAENAMLTLRSSGSIFTDSGNLMAMVGPTETWVMYVDNTGDLCFRAINTNAKSCFANITPPPNPFDLLKSNEENIENKTSLAQIIDRIEQLESELSALKNSISSK